jgi:DNA invertase Pin-like site-specific DNA recombinase
MQEKGINLVSNKENLDTSNPTGKLMLTMIAAINEFERANLLERQREGIAIAKREGKYKGRKSITVNSVLFEEHYNRYLRREISKDQLANTLKILAHAGQNNKCEIKRIRNEKFQTKQNHPSGVFCHCHFLH